MTSASVRQAWTSGSAAVAFSAASAKAANSRARFAETAAPDGGPLELEKEDFEELVVPMLVDAELCEDDDAAQAKFGELWSKLAAGGGGAAAEEASAPKLLTGKVSLKAQASEYEEAAANQAAHFDSGVQDVLNKEIDTSKVDDVEDGGLRDPKAEANAAARCERVFGPRGELSPSLPIAPHSPSWLRVWPHPSSASREAGHAPYLQSIESSAGSGPWVVW